MYGCRNSVTLEQPTPGLDFAGSIYSYRRRAQPDCPLTRHVIAETIQQRHVFPMSSQFHIGINVAASHFRHGTLLKDLNQYWFSQHPIQQLVIELTERDALLDVDYRIVRELNRLGVKLAIDDFGTETVHSPGWKNCARMC